MPIPFVGRARELQELQRLLAAHRNIVITGVFGSGRTTLVRQLQCLLERRFRFVFTDSSHTRAAIRQAVANAFALARSRNSRGPDSTSPRVVLVLDDVVRVTPQRARFIRETLASERIQMIVIADRTVKSDALLRLRATLGSAPVVQLGPLTASDVERYVSRRIEGTRVVWSRSELRAIARSTHGYPLGMRMTVDAALRQVDARAGR